MRVLIYACVSENDVNILMYSSCIFLKPTLCQTCLCITR